MVLEKIKAFFKKIAQWFKSLSKKQLWTTIICSVLAVATLTTVIVLVSCEPEEDTPPVVEQTTYTVTFETNGGSAISSVTVNEGTVLEKPADPQLTGSEFVGWYSDSTFKTPFYFDPISAKITSNVTLYARWEVVTAEKEYVIDFNTGVEGLVYGSVKTVNNKAFAGKLPTAIRSGYTFAGWAISMYDDAAKLSYMWTDGMTITENMTFHALWVDSASAKLATPAVNVTASGLTWKAVPGVSTYHVTVAGPVGFDAIATNTGSTTFGIDFTTAPIGEYEIIVTAVASDTTKNSAPAIRNYINKALSRVSFFEVEGTTLSFNAVANATDYLLTVVCGDSNHSHTAMSLGGQTQYDFASCLTSSGKVSFAVTSYAEGYVSATSRVYNYTKALDAVTGLAVDEATGMLTWNAVDKAEKYVVSVDCGNAAHDHDKVVVGDTQFDMKECEAKDGGIDVSVYAVAATYGDSVPATYNYAKTTMATPGNVKMSGTTMSWNEVNGATGGYKVKIGDQTIDVDTNSIDLSAQQIAWVEANDYVIQIQAIGADGAASLWSNDIDARYYAMYTSISYNEGYVTWNYVIGATSYSVKVNEGEAVVVDGGENYAPITFTQAGENVISVCYTDGTNTSDWVSTTVEAYAVEFDTMVSDTTFATQYKAVGDPTDSFYSDTIKKSGYTFYGWYTSEEVGAGNADLYEDLYFRTAEAIKLYADYTPKTYEITYDYGTGGVGNVATATVTFGQHYQFAIPKPTGESVFEGWYTAPNGKGTPLTDENGISINPWMVAVDEVANANVVYAYWNDLVLDFKLSKIGNQTVYAVSKGARINTVDHVIVPETYKGIPVKMVAAGAFLDCTKLKRISIPNTVEQIFTTGTTSFSGCILLEEINIIPVEGNKLIRYWSQDGVLFDNGKLDEQDGTVEVAAFPMNYAKKSYRIPEGVNTIPEGAFEGSLIEEITFSPDITSIETKAFYKAASLVTMNFEDPAAGEVAKPLVIDDRAFESCSSLEVVNLPARLQSIQTKKYDVTGTTTSEGPEYESVSTSHSTSATILDAFYYCSKLKAVNVAEGGEYYSSEDGILFNANKTVIIYAPKYIEFEEGKYSIPQGVNTIEEGAFVYCTKIEEIYIPATVTDIQEYAFYNAYGIQKITFGGNGFNDVTIGNYAFRSVSSLKEIIFEPNSRVATIGEGAFMYNYNMTTLNLPATITEIGNIAFSNWQYLTTVNFEEPTVEDAEITFGDAPFYNTKIATLKIPAHASDLGGIFNGMNRLKTIIVDEDNEYYTTVSGILYDIDKTEMLYWPADLTEGYELPDTLEVIGAGVFQNNNRLTSFEIPNTVKTVGDKAFMNSTIATITFESGNDANELTIGREAFRDNDRVSSITLPKRTKSVGQYAFSYMDGLTSLNLNEGLAEIGQFMIYQNNALQSLEIPDSVKKIGWQGIYKNVKLSSVSFGEDSQLEEIGGWGIAYNYNLQSIELPASLKKIGYYGLSCSSWTATSADKPTMTSVTFAEGSQLETIDPYAFYYLPIETITIPKTVKQIGYYAFYYCLQLTEVIFETGEGEAESLEIGGSMRYVSASNGSQSEQYGYAFYGCTSLEELVLPARTTIIGRYSFQYNYALKSVTVEEGKASNLQHIGEYAFRDCISLEYFFFPKSLTNRSAIKVGTSDKYARPAIGKLAFWGCTALAEADFEQGGTRPMTVGEGAFYQCESLTEVNLPSRLVTYTNDLTNETMPPLGPVVNVNNASMMFGNCLNLEAVNIVMNEDGTPYIAENELISYDGVVFSPDMTELVHLPVGRVEPFEIPNTVEVIGDYAVARAKKLTGITFEAGNDDLPLTISESAFLQCISLTEITLAKRVSVLETKAFQSCKNLASIELSANLTSFDATVFDGCEKLAAINVADGSTHFSSYGGVLFNAAETEADLRTLYYYPASKQETVYAVPASVQVIYMYAFYANSTLEEVILPEGLRSIEDYAFYNATALKTVHIRKNVEIIGDYAFYNCTSLESLTFEEGGTMPLVIGKEAYINTSVYPSSTTSTTFTYNGLVFANCPKLTSVVLPERTKVITDNAFYNCFGLKSANIPVGVEKLGRGIFRNCERLETVDIDAENSKWTVFPTRMFEYCYSLKSIVIPASVTEFEAVKTGSYSNKQSSAFSYCISLESVEFAEDCQIAELPNGLFAGCTSLTSIEIPASVTTIANGSSSQVYNLGVFFNCTSLSDVTFAEGSAIEYIGNYAFYGCEALETIEFPETEIEFGTYVFAYCSSLDNVVIPESANVDGSSYLFYYCTSLTNVTLPEMTEIPSGFFSRCSLITEFDIPDTVGYVGWNAFAYTGITKAVILAGVEYEGAAYAGSAVTEVVFEDGVNTLPDEMFYSCNQLEEVIVPDSVGYIGYMAFAYCENLRSVQLPNNEDFTYLSDELFEECPNLTDVEIPSCVTEIGYMAFYGAGIVELVIPDSVTYLYEESIEGCADLKKVTIGRNVAAIESYSFSGCSSLETVIFADGNVIDTITSWMFGNCYSLKNITLPDTVTTIESSAFQMCRSLETINIPAWCASIDFRAAFYGCYSLTSINIDPENETFVVEDGIVMNKAKTEILACLPQKTGSYTIPENVTIADGAFQNTNLDEIVLPTSLKKIPNYWFSGISADTQITIPEGVETIGEYAFAYGEMTTINIPASVSSIGKYAFQNCKNLQTVNIAGGNVRLAIGSNAFENCEALDNVVIPARVRLTATASSGNFAVGAYAFKRCYSLTNITFEETPAENGVEGILNFGSEAFMDCTSLVEVELPEAFGDGTAESSPAQAAISSLFRGCTSLASVTFNPVEGRNITLGTSTFEGCTSLKSIELPFTLVNFGYKMFAESGIESIVIPESVKAFNYSGLSTPNEIGYKVSKNVGRYFYNCTSLKSVVIKAQAPILYGLAFEGCTSLTSVTFETESLTELGVRLFDGCTGISSITLPASVSVMGANVFNGWTNAQTINVNKTIEQTNAWSVLWSFGSNANVVYLQA